MVNREIIERVQSLYSKGAASDNTRLSSRHIYSKLKSAKALIIKRELDKNRKVSDFNFDYLECIELQKAQPYECPCAPPQGCEILRTKCKLPDAVTYRTGGFIQSVSSIDGSIVFNKTTWEHKQYRQFNRYVKPDNDYFIKDGYLYITSNKNLQAITIKGLFMDELSDSCKKCCEDQETNCVSLLDRRFNIEPDLIDVVVELTVNEIVNPFTKLKQDEENDGSDRV